MRANGLAESVCWVLPPLTPWPRLDVVHFTAGRDYACPGRPLRIVTVHDLWDWHELEAGRLPQLTTAARRLEDMLSRADGVVCISAATLRDLERFLPEVRLPRTVVHHGIDPRFRRGEPEAVAEVRSRLGLPQDYLLYLGHHHQRKNVDRLVRAYVALPAQVPPLILAGNGDREDNRRLEALGGGRVRALGYLAEADVPAVISLARLTVFVPLHEGFGFPILESYRCGVPVVAGRGSSLDELVHASAIQVDPWDEGSIRDGIAAGCATPVDEGLRCALMDHAAAFTWERCARQTLDFYARVGSASGRGTG